MFASIANGVAMVDAGVGQDKAAKGDQRHMWATPDEYRSEFTLQRYDRFALPNGNHGF